MRFTWAQGYTMTEKIEHKRLPWTWADVCGQSKTCLKEVPSPDKAGFWIFPAPELGNCLRGSKFLGIAKKKTIHTITAPSLWSPLGSMTVCCFWIWKLQRWRILLSNTFYISRWRTSVCLFVSLLIQITAKTHVEPSNYFRSFPSAATS